MGLTEKNKQGCVHLYFGKGKGKTTAAAGLALRALGRGKKVTFVQFLKDGKSGEIGMLKQAGAQIFCGPPGTTFVRRMTETKKAETALWNDRILKEAAAADCDLLILDELCAARQHELVSVAAARHAVLERPEGREVVMTGRKPEEWMLDAADYITEMQCVRHPFKNGLPAREGIEF